MIISNYPKEWQNPSKLTKSSFLTHLSDKLIHETMKNQIGHKDNLAKQSEKITLSIVGNEKVSRLVLHSSI